MKQRSLAKNYFFNLGYQLLIVIVPLITTPYLSRVLGADGIGRYSYAQSIVSCFALAAALGTAVYGQRSIAICREDPKARTQIFWEVLALRALGVGTALGLYFALVVPHAAHPLLYALAAVELLAAVADISWLFQGLEDFQKITVCNGAVKLLSTAAIFLLVRQKSDLNIYVLLYCGSVLLGNLSLWRFLPACLSGGPGRLRVGRHLRTTLLLFLPQVAIYVYTVLDKTMLGALVGSDLQNGYYESAQKLQRVLLALATALGTVIIPRVAYLWGNQKKQEIQALLGHSFRMVFAIAFPAIVGIWVVAGRFVPLYYGPDFEPVAPLLCIFVWILLFAGLSGVTGNQYMIPTGQEGLYTQSVLAGAAINVCLNLALIPRLQAQGAALASVVAEGCITAIQMFQLRRQLSFRPLPAMALHYLLDALAMGLAAWGAGLLLGQGPLALVAMVALGGGVYGGLLLLQRDPLLQPETWKNMTRAGQDQPGEEEPK